MSLGIVVVEDDPHYRAGLEALFSEEAGYCLAGSFDSPLPFLRSAAEAARRGAQSHWDLVLMDLELPGMSGVEATRRVKALFPKLPVVVVTVFEEPGTILQAICAGADGYLLKKTPVPELLAQIESVASGASPLDGGVARSVLELLRRHPGLPGLGGSSPVRLELSDREQEVLRCLSRGLSYKQVADALGISLDTVRTYIRSVYKKLHVHSVSEAVGRAIREGLV